MVGARPPLMRTWRRMSVWAPDSDGQAERLLFDESVVVMKLSTELRPRRESAATRPHSFYVLSWNFTC